MGGAGRTKRRYGESATLETSGDAVVGCEDGGQGERKGNKGGGGGSVAMISDAARRFPVMGRGQSA